MTKTPPLRPQGIIPMARGGGGGCPCSSCGPTSTVCHDSVGLDLLRRSIHREMTYLYNHMNLTFNQQFQYSCRRHSRSTEETIRRLPWRRRWHRIPAHQRRNHQGPHLQRTKEKELQETLSHKPTPLPP